MQKEEQVSFLAEKIRQADAVLIGGGSGLSSAAGYNHYHWLPYMEECLQDFKEWYAPTGQPYYDQIYSNVEMIRRMNENIRELRVTSELLPRCNECGRIMVPWVRDDTFLEGKDWREGVRRYENFLKKYLMNGTDKNVVLLELGVGEMTPSIIKLPFWEMTYKNEKVFYACLNQKKSSAPEHIKDKGIYIAGDLAETLRDLKENIVGKEM